MKGYLVYGSLLLALTGMWQYRGWSFTSPTEIRGVPKSVRDNPGSYRSHYGYVPRYFGGK
jgi:hypothetical protein